MIGDIMTCSAAAVAPGFAAPGDALRGEPVRRRRISAEAGRALEILGHAIEYLADEYVHRAESLSAHDGPVEALQLLMRANRQVYFECPKAPTMADRWQSLLRALAA